MDTNILIELLHKGQKRKTGEPYTTHLYKVKNLLIEAGIDDTSIHDAALLHDALEDSYISKEYIAFHYGEKIANMVEILSKDPCWNTSFCRAKCQMDTIKSYAQIYPEVVLIKIADRIHNIQTIAGFSKLKQQSYLQETTELLLPTFEEIAESTPRYRKSFAYLISKLKQEIQNIIH